MSPAPPSAGSSDPAIQEADADGDWAGAVPAGRARRPCGGSLTTRAASPPRSFAVSGAIRRAG